MEINKQTMHGQIY